jgi:CheY-like chemotaxis protein
MPHTILCVDDDLKSLLLRTAILVRNGYRTLAARNGSDALNLLRANKDVRLVILDFRMPKMDGVETARRIKRMRPLVPIMMLSGEEMKDLPQCVDVYAEKTWPVEYLLTLVRMLTETTHRDVNESSSLRQWVHTQERKRNSELPVL